MIKLLLVEDNEMNRDMLGRRLIRKGFEVYYAENGLEAVEAAANQMFDIILMDMNLPVMDGWEATQKIRALSNKDKLPIIAVTAHAMSVDYEKAMNAGCDEYVSKPVQFDELLQKIAQPIETRNDSA